MLRDKVERMDLVAEDQAIQVSSLLMAKNRIFKPHRHIRFIKETERTQESWVVIKGSVLVFYYDIDGTELKKEILFAGDCSITLNGGHNYLILEDDTLVYEFKTGPYLGQEKDKVFL